MGSGARTAGLEALRKPAHLQKELPPFVAMETSHRDSLSVYHGPRSRAICIYGSLHGALIDAHNTSRIHCFPSDPGTVIPAGPWLGFVIDKRSGSRIPANEAPKTDVIDSFIGGPPVCIMFSAVFTGPLHRNKNIIRNHGDPSKKYSSPRIKKINGNKRFFSAKTGVYRLVRAQKDNRRM